MTSVDRTAMQTPRPNWLPEEEFPFESKFLQVNGHSIHYIDEGSGSLLLFVHAGPAWMFAYRDLIRRMSSGFRCVALDFPGAGLSSAAEDYEPGLEAASKVLEAFVITLDLTGVTLIAHDLGTPVGLAAFRHHSERMRAIAVTEGFGWSLSQENPRVARMLRLVGSRPFRAINWATNLLAWGMSSSYGVGRHLTRSGKVAFRGPYRDRRVRGRALTMLRDGARADAWLREVDLMLRSTLHDRPLLLVFGEKSPARREGFPEQWRVRFPGAALKVVAGAHHFPQMDDPQAVEEAIRSWYSHRVLESVSQAG